MRAVGVAKPHIYTLRGVTGCFYYGAMMYTPDGFRYGTGQTPKEAYDHLVRKLKAVGIYWEVFP